MHVKCKAHTEILINMATTTIFVKDLPRTLTKVGETVLGASSSVARVMDSIDRAARKVSETMNRYKYLPQHVHVRMYMM